MTTRRSASRKLVPTPVASGEAANKGYVDGLVATKVSATSTPNQLYLTDGAGAQITGTWSTNADPYSFVTRDANGRIRVGDPSATADAATKNYVDTQIGTRALSSHTHTKGDVGLGNVDNTADSAKNVLSATKLTTARTINGVSFDGTANITVPPGTHAHSPDVISSGQLGRARLYTGSMLATVNGTPTNTDVWYGTQAQYDAIGTKDANTEYNIYAT